MNQKKPLNPFQMMTKALVPRHLKFYAPKIPIFLDKKNFLVKTADNVRELRQALRLRHDVFLEEQLHRRKKSGLDIDRFDRHCDHLLIVDKRTGTLVGTYRLQSSLHTRRWYTATEFHMKQIRKLPGNKLELGRACVHPDYRNGVTIALLWEGIHAYMQASNTQYMFGCSSIKTMDRDEIRRIYDYLKQQNHLTDEHKVRPKGRFKIHGLHRKVRMHPRYSETLDQTDLQNKIPSLLQSYFRAGAKVCGTPALDKSFRCIDFLTLLDVSGIREQYNRRFQNQPAVKQG